MTALVLVSPSDGNLKQLLASRGVEAKTHWLPESYGADLLVVSQEWGKLGMQRKTVDDFFASISDGRLARELPLLSHVEFPILQVEGRPQWTTDGHLLSNSCRWTKAGFRNALRSIMLVHGVHVEFSDSLDDTADTVVEMASWWGKRVHRSLLTRPKTAMKDSWGTSSRRDVLRFVLQGFPGVGVALANAIIEASGGRLPLQWTMTQQQMMQVPGIGPRRAKMLWEVLEGCS